MGANEMYLTVMCYKRLHFYGNDTEFFLHFCKRHSELDLSLIMQISIHSSTGTLFTRPNPLNLSLTSSE